MLVWLFYKHHNNTLQIDGTTKKFKEYSTFNITTGSGESLSLGFEDQPSGSADDHMKATKNLFYYMSKLLLPCEASQK